MQTDYKQEPGSEQQQYSFMYLSQKTRSYNNTDTLNMVKYCMLIVHLACFTKENARSILYFNRKEKNYFCNVPYKDTHTGSYVRGMGLAHPTMGVDIILHHTGRL